MDRRRTQSVTAMVNLCIEAVFAVRLCVANGGDAVAPIAAFFDREADGVIFRKTGQIDH